MECHGIEPSQKAIDYREELIRKNQLKKIKLQQGFADFLPYEDSYFDAVYIGFCLYQHDRNSLFKSLSETDRVLKRGGVCVITDFDTPVPYIRENIHNKRLPTYKTDYADNLIPYGYSLIEKKTYSHSSLSFVKEIQERISTQILYKENVADFYIKD